MGESKVWVHNAKNCGRTANDPIRRDSSGNPTPDPEAEGSPHTQLGTRTSRSSGETYRQAVEFDGAGNPKNRKDFTDHGRPGNHSNPHQHDFEKVSGNFSPGPARPLDD